MDEIQKILVKAGRKDLAQKYYEKVAIQTNLTKLSDTVDKAIDKWLKEAEIELKTKSFPTALSLRMVQSAIKKVKDAWNNIQNAMIEFAELSRSKEK